MKHTSGNLIEILKSRVAKSSQKEVARAIGITPQFLNDLLRGRREVTSRVAEAIGFTKRVVFERMPRR